ncbi:MAG: hypothetical protein ACR2J4_10300, partial [Deinococcus sp.]
MRRGGRPLGWSVLGWSVLGWSVLSWSVLGGGLGGLALALLLGDLIGRQLGLGALGGGPEDALGTPRLALTFDDGP